MEEAMRRTVVVTAIALSLFIGQHPLLACGDKFFLVGRADRHARLYAAMYPGTVIIYTGGTTTASKLLGDATLKKFVNRAGHRVVLAATPKDLERVMASVPADVIVAEYSEALALQPQLALRSSQPSVFSLVDERTPAVLRRHHFDAELTLSDKLNVNHLLGKLDEVMKQRRETGRQASARPRG
jgi:hypothetical protein